MIFWMWYLCRSNVDDVAPLASNLGFDCESTLPAHAMITAMALHVYEMYVGIHL